MQEAIELANSVLLHGHRVFVRELEPFALPSKDEAQKIATCFDDWWYGKLTFQFPIHVEKQIVQITFEQFGEVSKKNLLLRLIIGTLA